MTTPSTIILKCSILLTTLLAFEARETIAYSFAYNVTIFIYNKVLAPTPADITVHCKSKDDDLGDHTLMPGESYVFSFKPTHLPFKNTLFFCSFTWPGNPHRHYLDIYDEAHDECKHCSWDINVNGGCLNDGKCVPWKSIAFMESYNTSKWPGEKGLHELAHGHPLT
ncbi:putative plant self-incompatibility S1 [Medicago truncatula]|uniref:S-protein homolog n=1 Tax=Medicago truncatula TaxID=3880 RepID=A0A072U6A1_MEDTR|nr:S-protein homolog 5 [Medicago truncatula]KEH25284.1 leguminosin group486 secreted peptide [Medicago truncatula]RHN50377.1 putative plant self-incompatibility S1 [Medicago truncatula]